MLDHPNIEILLNTDYFDVKEHYSDCEKLFYTGPIDRFFDFKHSLDEKLEYRSINFVSETVEADFFQENSVINYPGTEVDYTRIIEYKHFALISILGGQFNIDPKILQKAQMLKEEWLLLFEKISCAYDIEISYSKIVADKCYVYLLAKLIILQDHINFNQEIKSVCQRLCLYLSKRIDYLI